MVWEMLHTGHEGDDFQLNGTSIWGAEWRPTSKSVRLPDPAFGQEVRAYEIVEVITKKGTERIAITELSNLVFRFYVWRA